MPLFEYICSDCGQPFEVLVLNQSRAEMLVCPSCESPNVKKKISTFASRIIDKSAFSMSSNNATSCSTGST